MHYVVTSTKETVRNHVTHYCCECKWGFSWRGVMRRRWPLCWLTLAWEHRVVARGVVRLSALSAVPAGDTEHLW